MERSGPKLSDLSFDFFPVFSIRKITVAGIMSSRVRLS